MNLSDNWFAECGGTEGFLSKHWQRKPLFIRRAIENFQSPVTADELAGLSLEEEIESRLISGGKEAFDWRLKHGPFDENIFQNMDSSHWTLLVQAVDQWLPEVQKLRQYFDFLPQWRFDDIMISYAVDQGGVGPHFDQYDVFLLQGEGRRRWQTGQMCDLSSPLIEGLDLRILQHFEACDEWVLEPGDMLYLPPGMAHWGTAEGECISYSVGFRAPTGTEMLNDLATELLAEQKPQVAHVYRDPDFSNINPESSKGEIDKVFVESAKALLLEQLNDEKLIGEWFARYMTDRKYPELELDKADCSLSDCSRLGKNTTISRHPASRFAALPEEFGENSVLAVDGELYPCSKDFARLMANSCTLNIAKLDSFSDEEKDIVTTLLSAGSLVCDSDG